MSSRGLVDTNTGDEDRQAQEAQGEVGQSVCQADQGCHCQLLLKRETAELTGTILESLSLDQHALIFLSLHTGPTTFSCSAQREREETAQPSSISSNFLDFF